MLHTIPLGIVSSTAAAYLIEQSLLGDGTSSYLNRTPSVAGNRKTWTFSCWFKGTPVSSSFLSVEANDANGPQTDIAFQGGGDANKFEVYGYSSSYDFRLLTSSLYRDSSAWYHIVVAMDTTQATAANRTKIYINGTQVTSFGTSDYPTLNYDTGINALKEHFVMKGPGAGGWVNGAVALPILVDGAALAPTAFGETDDGFWNPIEYTGVETPASAAITYALTDSGVSGSSAVTNTYSTKSIGAADAGRTVIVGVSSNGTNIVTGMTIGGVSATELTVFTGTNNTGSIWAAAVPSGTTADIVITNAGGGAATGIAVYRALNVGSLTAYSAGGVTVGDPMTATVFAPAGSAIFAAGGGYNPASFVWTGVNEDTDLGALASGEDKGTHGSIAIATDQSVDVGCDPSSGMSEGSMAAVVLTGTSFVAGGYGTNGGAYNFADTTFFGKNISGTDDQAALSSAAPAATAWINITGAWTMGSGTASRTTTVNAIRSASVFTGDFSLALTMASGATAARVGVYAANEDGTFASSGAGGGMDSMTNSFYSNFGAASFYKGSSTTASVSQTNGAITITRVSGTITINTAGGNHTFSATYTGPMRFVLAGGGATMSFTGIAYTADGQAGTSYFDTGFTTTDQLADVPTSSVDDGIGNFATWNALKNDQVVLSEGNLNTVGQTAMGNILSTIPITAGMKIAFEVEIVASDTNVHIGMWKGSKADTTFPPTYGLDGDSWSILHSAGGNSGIECKYNSIRDYFYTASGDMAAGDKFHIEIDKDAGEVFVWINDGGGYVAFNSGLTVFDATAEAAIIAEDNLFIAHSIYQTAATNSVRCNFGQKAFDKTPTAGYTGLATQNLPAPTIADGSQYFNTVIYAGDGNASGTAREVGFRPDLVWIKSRTASTGSTYNHTLTDSIRGVNLQLSSNSTAAETGLTNALTSFNDTGFTVAQNVIVNHSGDNYVAWCWKAGGAASSNTDGSITSSVSANTTSGFSIISYTGTGASYATPTIGHGLGSAPKFYIIKNRGQTDGWAAFHDNMDTTNPWNDRHLRLDTSAAVSGALHVSGAAPTSSIIYLDSDHIVNASSEAYICYAWAEVEGFSKFGSYKGNANVDGPFVYTGFRPAFVLAKSSSSSGTRWMLIDSVRHPYNDSDASALAADSTETEAQVKPTNAAVDLLSNGFKIRSDSSDWNASGGTYIYAAFAEHPFQGAGGVTQARSR